MLASFNGIVVAEGLISLSKPIRADCQKALKKHILVSVLCLPFLADFERYFEKFTIVCIISSCCDVIVHFAGCSIKTCT